MITYNVIGLSISFTTADEHPEGASQAQATGFELVFKTEETQPRKRESKKAEPGEWP